MAKAIACGALKKGLAGEADILAYNPHADKYEDFPYKNICRCESAEQLAKNADIIFLCVKPQSFTAAFAPISGLIRPEQTLVSIMAGISSDTISGAANAGCGVIRAMPNTPLLLGCGTVAVAPSLSADKKVFDYVFSLFEALGTAYLIDESRFSAVIPVNGSSPAFLYHFAGLIAAEADAAGIQYDTALHMFADTMIGSARMLLDSGESAEKLTENVCSKGGTTIAALDAMRDAGFDEAVKSGFEACVKRAEELAGK